MNNIFSCSIFTSINYYIEFIGKTEKGNFDIVPRNQVTIGTKIGDFYALAYE